MSTPIPFLDKRGVKARIARLTGLSHQAISKWPVVPAEHVLAVCAEFAWVVTPHDLRPDIYPHPDDGLPPERRGGGAGKEAA